MKTAVEELGLRKDTEPFPDTYKQLLKKSGFKRAALSADYQHISEQAIFRFLQKVAKERHYILDEGEDEPIYIDGDDHNKGIYISVYKTNSDGEDEEFELFEFCWKQTPVEEYAGTPPTHVLTSLQRARKDRKFETFMVVELQEIKIPDPLLIGISDVGERYLIDWWDNDIDPIDLIECGKEKKKK